jgi:hypothetical protein
MLEAYSLNTSVLANGTIPFNSVALEKGCTTELEGTSTIELNKCGIYEIVFNATATPTVTGTVTVQMTKNGVVQPQATRTITGATTTASVNTPITTLVQVSENNTSCCCTKPTTIQFISSGNGLNIANTNVVVTKIC